ncbi:hypothetical protein SDC9_179736 [bioreactor metagenome]|uniref:Uncharacterized protein n=1 Tax=bioreactor metagenome TaxID=1076179 RepID=A0A645GZU4_9ZZZZ
MTVAVGGPSAFEHAAAVGTAEGDNEFSRPGDPVRRGFAVFGKAPAGYRFEILEPAVDVAAVIGRDFSTGDPVQLGAVTGDRFPECGNLRFADRVPGGGGRLFQFRRFGCSGYGRGGSPQFPVFRLRIGDGGGAVEPRFGFRCLLGDQLRVL